MRLIIAGSRPKDGVPSKQDVLEAADDVWIELGRVTEVVSGGCRGPDRWGEEWAAEKGIPVRTFPADWKTHGKAAGPIRNVQMANYADALLAVWDGKSRGTKHMISSMKNMGKPCCIVFTWQGEGCEREG